MGNIHLIAENDGAGNVLWVWRWDGSNTRARPLKADSLPSLPLNKATVHGASRAAVAKWLKAQKG